MTPPRTSLTPVAGECIMTVQPSQPGAQIRQTASRMYRASDGKMRIDTGNISMITDPGAQRMILLDHVAKEARVFPMQTVPQPPGMPAPTIPGAPPMPVLPPPQVRVEELGKATIDGWEVEGKRYTIQPPAVPPLPQPPPMPGMPAPPAVPGMPAPPQVPGMPPLAGMPAPPQMPGMPPVPGAPPLPAMPQVPGMPPVAGMPQVPQPPAPPPAPIVSELWTSTQLKLPVYTRAAGSFGEQTTRWRYRGPWEPDPGIFQIPPGYRPPAPPAPPAPPTIPNPPKLPNLPG